MIEILECCDISYTVDNGHWPTWEVKSIKENLKMFTVQEEELCDALWEAVKYILKGD